jgi:hypothetical protein
MLPANTKSNASDTEVVVITPMTKEEAMVCVDKIKAGLSSVREHLLDLHERMGWKALGYDSFRACAVGELGTSSSHAYRELAAGKMERQMNLPVGESKESHLRVLGMILTELPDIQRAYELAISANDNPTAHHFLSAAHIVYVQEHGHERVWSNLSNSRISAQKAHMICMSIKASDDKQFIDVVSRCTDPSLIPLLSRLHKEDSETWQEIVATKCIPGLDEQVPLQDAVLSNLKAWLSVASTEHRAMSIAASQRYYELLNEAALGVIEEARRVSGHPNLRAAIIKYDQAKRGNKKQDENSVHKTQGI